MTVSSLRSTPDDRVVHFIVEDAQHARSPRVSTGRAETPADTAKPAALLTPADKAALAPDTSVSPSATSALQALAPPKLPATPTQKSDSLHPPASSQTETPATRAPVPAWLKIGFAHDVSEADRTSGPEAMASALGQGRPFKADVDAKLRKILGAPLCAGGIEAVFTRAWPSAVWVASYEEVDPEFDMPRFTLSAIDRAGKVIFDVMIGFLHNADGSVDCHAAGADVDMDHRGFGITAYAELMREKILQAFSKHPQSHLSLQASNAINANTGAAQPPSGFYLHAARGYLLSDTQNVAALPYPLETPDIEADKKLSQTALLAKYFKLWAQTLEPPLGEADCRVLTATCTQPFDYVRLNRQGRPLGVEYLVSGHAPPWYGVHFVNPPVNVTASGPAARDRHRSQAVWEGRLGHEIASADKRGKALQQTLWQQVQADDARTRATGYRAIGMHAHPEAADFLQDRLEEESQPQVKQALKQALADMRNENVDAGLRNAADDTNRPNLTRDEMRARLAARGAQA